MRNKCILIVFACLIIHQSMEAYQLRFGSQELNAFYRYDEKDLKELKELPLVKEASLEQVENWVKLFHHLAAKFEHECNSASMVYLFTAFRDAALISLENHQKITDLDPLGSKLALLFYPQYRQIEKDYDPLSEQLSEIIYEKYEKRFHREQRQARTYSENDSHYREGNYPKKELRLEHCVPWLIGPVYQYRVPPPPAQKNEIFWNTQMALILDIQKGIGERQIKAVKKWAAGDKFSTSPGDWAIIGLEYIKESKLPLEKKLFAASCFTQGLFNTSIAIFDSKYAYLIKRPSILDKHIKEYIPIPPTPSYPSGHAAFATSAALLLEYFFPENKEEWQQMAVETSLSRVWGGIHTPLDITQGIILGTRITEAFLDKIYTSIE